MQIIVVPNEFTLAAEKMDKEFEPIMLLFIHCFYPQTSICDVELNTGAKSVSGEHRHWILDWQ